MNRPEFYNDIAKLRLRWRRETREWLRARRHAAALAGDPGGSIEQCIAAEFQLAEADRRRRAVALALQQLHSVAENQASTEWSQRKGWPYGREQENFPRIDRLRARSATWMVSGRASRSSGSDDESRRADRSNR